MIPTLGFKLLYGLIITRLERRQLVRIWGAPRIHGEASVDKKVVAYLATFGAVLGAYAVIWTSLVMDVVLR